MTAGFDASAVLRPGLLQGVSIIVAGVPSGGLAPGELTGGAPTVGDVCTKLGATVHTCDLLAGGPPEQDDAAVEQAVAVALRKGGGVHMLVVDAAALFLAGLVPNAQREVGLAQAGGLIDALEASWRVTRAVANAAFIADGDDNGGGRTVYVAPPTAAGTGSRTHADATRAGLENLARTLSIEWARYGITPVSIATGPGTTAGELAGIVAYLASPAGAYFSGCQLDLRGASAR